MALSGYGSRSPLVGKKCHIGAIGRGRLVVDDRGMNDHPKKIQRCPACGAEDVVAISMSLDVAGVVFQACHKCEHRWWEQDGYEIPLETVLDLVPRR